MHEIAGCLAPSKLCAAWLDHPRIQTRFGADIETLPEGPVVIALGMGSARFMDAPLQSLRGQITIAAATQESAKIKNVICHKGFITPAVDGLHVIGATFQRESPGDTAVREEDHAENLATLHRHVPGLGELRVVGGRAGYRATTPDKMPLAGKVSENVYISTGFGAHGISGALIAGEVIASMIAGDPAPVPQSLLPYLAPDRFARRKKAI